jgi:hypothetical protein
MKVGIRLGIAGVSLLLSGLPALAPDPAHAQQGAISGQVVDQADGTPLEAARVLLTGTSQIETTNREGRFLFRQVTPGTHQVRVLRVGYKQRYLYQGGSLRRRRESADPDRGAEQSQLLGLLGSKSLACLEHRQAGGIQIVLQRPEDRLAGLHQDGLAGKGPACHREGS